MMFSKNMLDIMDTPYRQSYRLNLIFERDEGIAWQVFRSQTPMFIEDSARKTIPVKSDLNIPFRLDELAEIILEQCSEKKWACDVA
jgi:hypothetical protein